MTFQLITMLWLFALLASAIGTFGPGVGLPCAAGALLLRQGVHCAMPTKNGVATLALVLGGVQMVALLWLAVANAHPASNRNQSLSHLKQLTLAIHYYHDTHDRFPPPYTVDEEGEPLHSWRTLLLPFMEEGPLYKAINLDEPWDSPANKKLLEQCKMDVFQSPRDGFEKRHPCETHYFAIVDPSTAWSPHKPISFAHCSDGSSRTILLMEAPGKGVPWYEPRDLTLDEAVDLLTGTCDESHEVSKDGFFASNIYRYQGVYPTLSSWVDGHASSMGFLPDKEPAVALLTRNGQEEVYADDIPYRDLQSVYVRTEIHWGRIWSLSLFVALSLAPWSREKPATDEPGDVPEATA